MSKVAETVASEASEHTRTRAKLSACIIARDEAEHLPACLSSVEFCDEIVVVDSGSRDATVQLAEAAGARVVHQPWLGFAAQRNVGLDHACGEWVLEIDADERVSATLRSGIEAFLGAPPPDVDLGGLPLREIFLGHPLGASAKYPKYRHRLVRRGAQRHDEQRTVHEGLIPQGPVHPFEGDLVHLLADGWREALGDAWRYARLEAGQLDGVPPLARFVKGALLRPATKLCYRLSIYGGWRDGWRGLARIAIDCGTDSIVWIRYMLGLRGGERGHSGVSRDAHYGSQKFHRGSLRVIGVAAGEGAGLSARQWLATARTVGADVALIGEQTEGVTQSLRTRTMSHLGPLTLIRALDAEEQLRSIDLVVAFGWRAQLLLRCVPRGLRGHITDITHQTDPLSMSWTRDEEAAWR